MMRILMMLVAAGAVFAGGWSEPAIVLHDDEPAVVYRARWTGEHLVVEAKLAQGFHTFTMDNRQRVAEKLAGKPALATDLPTTLKVTGGLELVAPWYQSQPKDFSKPELRLFAFGFENEAVFVTKAKRAVGATAQVAIRGQACTDKVCKNIDLDLDVALDGGNTEAQTDLKSLVPVK